MCTERLDDLPRQQRALGAAGGRLQPRLPEHGPGLRPAAGEPGPRAVAVQLQHWLHHADQTQVRRFKTINDLDCFHYPVDCDLTPEHF